MLQLQYRLSTSVISILVFLISFLSASRVVPIDFDIMDQIFRANRPAVILLTYLNYPPPNEIYIKYKENDVEIVKQFEQSAQAYQHKYGNNSSAKDALLFVISHQDDWIFSNERRKQYFGIYPKDIPTIVYFQNYTSSKKYVYPQKYQLNSVHIAEFLSLINNGTISEFYKSQPIPSDEQNNNRMLQIMVGKNFEQTVLTSNKQYMIIFYDQWDYKNRVIKLQLIKVAQSLLKNKNIRFAKINGIKNEIQHSFIAANDHIKNDIKINVRKLPIIYFWKKDKTKKPIQFSVFRFYQYSYQFMIQWIKDHTEYEWIQPEQVCQQVNEQF